MHSRYKAASSALLAAALFGAATPVAKVLLGSLSPFMVAGLFYVGSGIGLAAGIVIQRCRATAPERLDGSRIEFEDVPWLVGAIAAGGVAGPALLMLGLNTVSAATSSLLLNFEAVFTAMIAWIVFRENADLQIVLGMVAIVAGGVALSWQSGGADVSSGAWLVVGACLAWAIDNNLTRKVSTNNAVVIACAKGLAAGPVNLGIAFSMGAHLPNAETMTLAMLTGFAGYGISLVLFVVALRNLGTGRTSAYFSVGPLFGVALSLYLWPQMPSPLFWVAAALMGLGIWLHIRERHAHQHTHEVVTHNHRHRHDAHHQHKHDFEWDGHEPHAHLHQHEPITHMHAHFPDVHHRHMH